MTSPSQRSLHLPPAVRNAGDGRPEPLLRPAAQAAAAPLDTANNFDAVRLAAALVVLASHAFVLVGVPEAEPVAILTGHATDAGAIAVAVLFSLSGFLLARSAERHPWRRYVAARAARIYPGLIAAVLAQTLLLGPAVSAAGAGAYLTDPVTWTALVRALVLNPLPGLPGVFEANPFPGVVNASLWTLRIEVVCYLGTLAWLLLGTPRWLVGAAVVAGAGALAAAHAGGAGLRVTAVLDCMLHFAAGAALWCWRDRVTPRFRVAVLLVAAAVAGGNWPGAPAAWHVAIPYAVVWIGVRRGPQLPDDISYGTYLYAFPVCQLLVAAWPQLGPWSLAGAALPPTLLLAVLSRRFVERPALRWRRG